MKKLKYLLMMLLMLFCLDLNVKASDEVNYNGCANLYYDDLENMMYFYLDGKEYMLTDAQLLAAAQNGKKIYWFYSYQPYFEMANTATPTSKTGYLMITVDDVPQIYASEVSQTLIDTYYYKTKYKFNNVYIQPQNNTIGYDPTVSYLFLVDEQYSNYTYSNYNGLFQRFKYQGVSRRTLLDSNSETSPPHVLTSYGAINDENYVLEMIDNSNTSKKITVDPTTGNYCKSEGTFLLDTEEITDNITGEVIAEKITATFGEVDTEKYKYEFIDVNATDKMTEFVPNEEKKYEWFFLKNNAFCVYVSDRNSGEKIFSNCETESNIDEERNYFVISENSEKDEYVEYEGKKVLYSKYINVRLNDIALLPYLHEYIFPYYRTSTWSDVSGFDSSGNGMDFWLIKNEDITLEIMGLNTGIQHIKKYSLNGSLEEINNLPEFITWEENCRSGNTYCIVSTRFVNYDQDKHQYYVRKGENDWEQVYPQWFNRNQLGFYNFPESNEVNTYCAMVKDKNEIILQSCYTNQQFSAQANFKTFITRIKKFINDQNSTIKHISAMVEKSYLLIDVKIRTFIEFIYFLACLYAVVWNVRR